MIQLGRLAFSDHAIPEEVAFGGEQRLVIHDLVGGRRVIDAMGRADTAIQWHGVFWGLSAETDAQTLNAMRVVGKPLPLLFNSFSYTVVIRSLELRALKPWMVIYRVECDVVQDTPAAPTAGQDAAIYGDWQSANAQLNGLAANPVITSLTSWPPVAAAWSAVTTGIQTVASWQSAVQAQVNAVLQPLAAVQTAVNAMMGTFSTTLAGAATVAGLVTGGSWVVQGAKLLTQAEAMTALPAVKAFSTTIGRLAANLGSVATGSTAQTIQVGGGSLFDVAAQQYGDASKWTLIARANGLTDPQLTGVHTLIIPPASAGTGGVLQQ